MFQRLSIMRVTRVTEKRVYGSIDGISTHCTPSDVYGEYDTEEAAQAAYRKLYVLKLDYDNRIMGYEREIRQLEQSRDTNIRNALGKLRICK